MAFLNNLKVIYDYHLKTIKLFSFNQTCVIISKKRYSVITFMIMIVRSLLVSTLIFRKIE